MSPRRALLGVLSACVAAALPAGVAAAAVPAATNSGAVHFVKVTGPEFDHYTDDPSQPVTLDGAPSTLGAWMNAKFWRSVVYEPYFDNKTSWYTRGWLYKDSYAIYSGSPIATQHPEWILHDAQGNKLYIPWGCSNGTCPQYAADIGNPAYRAWIVDQVKTHVAMGYKGVWFDDVNLDFRVGDGSGAQVLPQDPRTGTTMTDTAWRDYFATLTEDLRSALPSSVEILHNSIWYAGGAARDADPSIQREINAADFINLERGVNDDGLTGGTGQWSLNALLGFVDRVHAKGKGVVFDSLDNTAQGREYDLGAYFLVSSGRDGVGLKAMAPDTWWSMYDADLGLACGARTTTASGLLRRDFTGGTVFVNEPGAPTRTGTVATPLTDESGHPVTSVSVPAKGAAILRGATGCTPSETAIPATSTTSTTTTTTTSTSGSTTGTTTGTTTTSGSTTTTTTTTSTPPTRSGKRPRLKITSVSSRRMSATTRARAAVVGGRRLDLGRARHYGAALVSGEAGGLPTRELRVTLQRKAGRRWLRTKQLVVRLGEGPGWTLDLRGLTPGAHRIVVAGGGLRAAHRFAVAV